MRDAAVAASKHVERGVDLTVDARVDHKEDGYRLSIRTWRAGAGSAERRLEAASCGALADATTLIAALAFEPGATPAEQDTAAASAATRPPTVPASAAPRPADGFVASAPNLLRSLDEGGRADARAADGARVAHRFALGAAVASDLASLPSPSLGGQAALAFTSDRLRLEALGSFFGSQSRGAEASAAGGTLGLVTVGARGCFRLLRGPLEVSPCVGTDVHLMRARGYGALENYDTSAAWTSIASGALLRVPMASWLAARAQLEAALPLARPRFVVEGEGAIHEPAAFGAKATIGVEALFL